MVTSYWLPNFPLQTAPVENTDTPTGLWVYIILSAVSKIQCQASENISIGWMTTLICTEHNPWTREAALKECQHETFNLQAANTCAAYAHHNSWFAINMSWQMMDTHELIASTSRLTSWDLQPSAQHKLCPWIFFYLCWLYQFEDLQRTKLTVISRKVSCYLSEASLSLSDRLIWYASLSRHIH